MADWISRLLMRRAESLRNIHLIIHAMRKLAWSMAPILIVYLVLPIPPQYASADLLSSMEERVKQAVVVVKIKVPEVGKDGKPTGWRVTFMGTGFFINEAGYFVTNSHLFWQQGRKVQLSRDIDCQIILYDKRMYFVDKLLAEDIRSDIAICSVNLPPGEKVHYLKLSEIPARVGHNVLVVAHPKKQHFSVGRGTIKGIRYTNYKNSKTQLKSFFDGQALVHSALFGDGASGAPLVDEQGNVVAIHFGHSDFVKQGRMTKSEGEASPVENVRRLRMPSGRKLCDELNAANAKETAGLDREFRPRPLPRIVDSPGPSRFLRSGPESQSERWPSRD